MIDLLTPEACSRAQAQARCERFLCARTRAWRWLRLGVGPERRGDLAALVAWQRVLRSAPTESSAPRVSSAPRAELRAELERVLGGQPTTPLGLALAGCVRRFALAPELLAGPLAALEEHERVGALTTRGELLALAGRLALPEGRLLLGVLEEPGERARVLSDALCTGLQIARWTLELHSELEQGRLRVPSDELFRCGVTPQLLSLSPADERVRRLVAAQVAWARELLAKGWPLCRELGPRRGRALGFVLRWHAAGLSALELRGFRLAERPPPGSLASSESAGWLRGAACAAAALVGRPPRLVRAG